jgi:hypothetical protein
MRSADFAGYIQRQLRRPAKFLRESLPAQQLGELFNREAGIGNDATERS